MILNNKSALDTRAGTAIALVTPKQNESSSEVCKQIFPCASSFSSSNLPKGKRNQMFSKHINRFSKSLKLSVSTAAIVAAAFASSTAFAAPIFVGSYQVDDGPNWGTNPAVYSATEAAALIFGGVASDYDISVNASLNPNTITNTGWYTIWGIANGTQFNEDYKLDLGAPGYNSPGGSNTAISAYTDDNAIGAQYTNYVWRVDSGNVGKVPEPATLALLGLGLVGLGFSRRKRAE